VEKLVPRSPCSSCPRNRTYCSGIDVSRPRRARTRSRVCSSASEATYRFVGSGETTRARRKVTVTTPKITVRLLSSRTATLRATPA
jgi:hypothetical protein